MHFIQYYFSTEILTSILNKSQKVFQPKTFSNSTYPHIKGKPIEVSS